jgi:glycosyltransferase involved in cell wall biosynthesis
MYRCTDAVLCGSRHTQGEVPGPAAARTIYLPENAIDPARFHRLAEPASGPLDVCFVGRLVPYKGPDMLLEAALPLLQRGVLRLNIVGDGPLAESLRETARQAGVEAAVSFHGWVEHTRVQDLLCSSHVMALPSVREFGGGVVLEAMALGVVPLVVDYAGPGELVDDSVGFKVPLGERASIVAALRERLEALAHERHDLGRLATAARTRVHEHFTWDVKARQVLEAYRWVLGRRDSKPEFGFVTH